MTAPLSIHHPTSESRSSPPRGVLVLQEAFGVNEHIEDVCARLAAVGYLAVAPHLFHRTGDPQFGYDDISQVRPHMTALERDEILSDVDDALAELSLAGVAPRSIGVVGFCMGGTIALHVAALRTVGAAVTFYGGGLTEGRFGFPALCDEAANLQAPWLGLYGDLDQGIPVDDVEQLRLAAATAAHPTEVVRYAAAGHGFNCDVRASYHESSADDAWERMLAWFASHLTA